MTYLLQCNEWLSCSDNKQQQKWRKRRKNSFKMTIEFISFLFMDNKYKESRTKEREKKIWKWFTSVGEMLERERNSQGNWITMVKFQSINSKHICVNDYSTLSSAREIIFFFSHISLYSIHSNNFPLFDGPFSLSLSDLQWNFWLTIENLLLRENLNEIT